MFGFVSSDCISIGKNVSLVQSNYIHNPQVHVLLSFFVNEIH